MKNVYDFTDLKNRLPKEIILDSSVLLNVVAIPPTHPANLASYEQINFFLDRIAHDKRCVGFAPFPALLECFHVLVRDAIEGYATENNIDRRPDEIHKQHPSIIRELDTLGLIDHFLAKLRAVPLVLVQPQDINSSAFEGEVLSFMDRLDLMTTDASIVAVANALGINDIASVDRDFLRITRAGFNLYTLPRFV